MRANFMNTLDDMLINILKWVCPAFLIPGVGNQLEEKFRNSYFVKMLHCAWTMLSLM